MGWGFGHGFDSRLLHTQKGRQWRSFLRMEQTGAKLSMRSTRVSARGEAEKEKGPVDLFPAEPTDAAALLRGDRLLSAYGADVDENFFCVLEQTTVILCAIIHNTFLKERISHGNN